MDSFTCSVSPPDFRAILLPFLSGLPGAAISTQPATTLLPLLSPILRQRVQLLSSASAEPWIRLLTYDADRVPQLTAIAQSGCLEPHPVSGEIEVDWDYDLEVRHKRLDEETLQIYLVLHSFDLFFRLVHCTGDEEGGGDGWRVGEVGAAGDPSASLASFGGFSSIWEAEKAFKTYSSSSSSIKVRQPDLIGANGSLRHDSPAVTPVGDVDDDAHDAHDDDDDYWGRYDATSAQQTPAATNSPAPQSMARVTGIDRSTSAEDAYYAQYDSVQPAMDNHDPDEEPERTTSPPPRPLGLGMQQHQHQQDQEQQQDDSIDDQPTSLSETSGTWMLADAGGTDADGGGGGGKRSRSRSLLLVANDERAQQLKLMHPRPESSASSQGSLTVARLEETAERHDQSAFGVKQHISRSLRSLFLLSRASGIDRDEFERMVRTELDVLGMVEDSI